MMLKHILILSIISFTAQVALSADFAAPQQAPTVAPSADKLSEARRLIDRRQWASAADELRRLDDRGSADWNNLMGYALRQGAAPDLAASERYYEAALRIDPHHRNTLEYSGELYLMKGDLARSKARLAELDAQCGQRCPQFIKLKEAVERYESNGNRFVPGGW